MPLSVTPLQTSTLTALRAFLMVIVPTNTQVIKGQVNRTAPPKGDYVVMTPIHRVRMATNTTEWDMQNSNPTTQNIYTPVQLTVQIDVHGDDAADTAGIISGLIRDTYCVQFMEDNDYALHPVDADDASQMPFINAQNQYEDRWVLRATLQTVSLIVTPAIFAESIAISVNRSDGLYVMFVGDNAEYVTFTGDNDLPIPFGATTIEVL